MPLPVLLTPMLAVLAAPMPAAEWRFHAEAVLGTRLDMVIACASAEAAQRGAEAALAEISRLDGLLSWRDPASELARLNCAGRMVVSPELFEVLQRAAHWRAVSDGAFDERLGRAFRLWREGAPEAQAVAVGAAGAEVKLEPAGRIVTRGAGADIDLDAIAKGYIVDRALAAIRAATPDAAGALVSIGGDMAGWRGDGKVWRVGLPEAGLGTNNAALDAVVEFANGAVATSGHGGRDAIVDGRRIGPALDARAGAPADDQVCATVRAGCAMDADALATIALVLPPVDAIALADATDDAALRITGADGRVHTSSRWSERPELTPVQLATPPATERWPIDWRLAIWYKLPERRERDADFREPYMAVWITDEANKPVRTLFMVGRNPEWQRENYLWWKDYRARAENIIDARSEATAPTGRYAFTWEGHDDAGKRVPSGKYTIHIETSRERGAHTHRIMKIEIGKERFEKTMPPLIEAGGFTAVFSHYNDLLLYAPE